MDQVKIGRFIQERRKEKNITQQELAEKLGVTDRSVSNWENGKNMPDVSLYKELCDELDISVNELISGEKLNDEQHRKKADENVVRSIKKINKEKKIKIMLITLVIISLIIIISYIIYSNIQLIEVPMKYDSRVMKCHIESDKVFYSFQSSLLHPIIIDATIDNQHVIILSAELANYNKKHYNFEVYQNMANLNDKKQSIYRIEGSINIDSSIKTKVYYSDKKLSKNNVNTDKKINKLIESSHLMCSN